MDETNNDYTGWDYYTPAYSGATDDYGNPLYPTPSVDPTQNYLTYTPYQYPTDPYGGSPYDDNGYLMPGWALDENNNPVWTGDASYNNQTGLTASGQNPYGQTVYNPDGTTTYYPPGASVPGMGGGATRGYGGTGGQPGQQQPGQQQGGQQQGGGLLGNLLGGGGSSGGLLGGLGGLALVGGLGALLGSMLSGKSSSDAGGGGTISAPAANLGAPKELVAPGVNPGYAMGQPVQMTQPLQSNLGNLINPSNIQTTNPQTLGLNPVAPQPNIMG